MGDFGDGGGGFAGGSAGEASGAGGYDGAGEAQSASTGLPESGNGLSRASERLVPCYPAAASSEPVIPGRYDTPPSSWAKEHGQHWQAVPEALRPYLHQRESEAHQRISELGPAAAQHREIAAAFERYGLQQLPQGVTHAAAIEHLLAVNHALQTNPGPVIEHLARQAGIDLRQLGGGANDQHATQRASKAESAVRQLQAELQALKQRQQLEATQRYAQAAQAEHERHIRDARRQIGINQRNGQGGAPAKGSLRDSLQRHADRLLG